MARTKTEEWLVTYFDRYEASMPGSSIYVKYIPKYADVPPCPKGTPPLGGRGRAMLMIFSGFTTLALTLATAFIV